MAKTETNEREVIELGNLDRPKVSIYVIGRIWQPGVVASASYYPRVAGPNGLVAGEIDGEWTREEVEDWLARNAGDFREMVDFRAELTYAKDTCECCGQANYTRDVLDWSDEENEARYYDTLYGKED